jgi:hypothetical protein
MANHSFGAVMIEAYQQKELRKYIDDLQDREPNAFSDFQSVTKKLEHLPTNREIVENAKKDCSKKQ